MDQTDFGKLTERVVKVLEEFKRAVELIRDNTKDIQSGQKRIEELEKHGEKFLRLLYWYELNQIELKHLLDGCEWLSNQRERERLGIVAPTLSKTAQVVAIVGGILGIMGGILGLVAFLTKLKVGP